MNKWIETYFNFEKVDGKQLIKATWETLYMTTFSMLAVTIIGLILGLILFSLQKQGTKVSKVCYAILSVFTNICRSIPFIILIILLIPITRQVLGTFLGPTAAIFALVVSAAPFYARLVEMALREVDEGVLEASRAMGMTHFEIIRKVLLPESLPALLSGGTVTTITMIGFTAMAGAINAGGLGGIAYQDGFMRNNLTVTLVATILLLVIVFIVQGIGDSVVKAVDKRQNKQETRSLKVWGIIGSLALVVLLGFSLTTKNETTDLKVLKVGASPTPHSEILEHIKPLMKKEGIQLEVVKFDDFILPNKALAEKEIDANYFQHEPFFDLAVAENNYDFVNQGAVHIELMGLYSKKWHSIKELPKNATLLVSNSTADWGRVITILQEAGLVKVKQGVSLLNATFDDIVENPKNIKFSHQLNPELLTTAYENDEADLIAINANYADTIGLSPKTDGLLVEKEQSPYGNILVSRKDNDSSKEIETLKNVIHSESVKKWIMKKWDGKIQPID